jgi:hypothetical protein
LEPGLSKEIAVVVRLFGLGQYHGVLSVYEQFLKS